MSDVTSALPEGLALQLPRLLGQPGGRVQRLTWGGRAFWLKRPEAPRKSLRWRLQKGDPLTAFGRERAGLAALGDLGAPVPRMVAAGPDYLVLEDGGPTLAALLAASVTAEEIAEAARAVAAAGRALGRLHARGLAHGRPYLRDLCWDGARITMIDFESFRPRNGAGRQGRDAVLFLASLLAQPGGAAQFAPALDAWRAEAPAAAYRAAGRWVAVLRLLAPLAILALRIRRGNREVEGYLALSRLWPG